VRGGGDRHCRTANPMGGPFGGEGRATFTFVQAFPGPPRGPQMPLAPEVNEMRLATNPGDHESTNALLFPQAQTRATGRIPGRRLRDMLSEDEEVRAGLRCCGRGSSQGEGCNSSLFVV